MIWSKEEGTDTHLIENMECVLAWCLTDDSRFLQQVCLNGRPWYIAISEISKVKVSVSSPSAIFTVSRAGVLKGRKKGRGAVIKTEYAPEYILRILSHSVFVYIYISPPPLAVSTVKCGRFLLKPFKVKALIVKINSNSNSNPTLIPEWLPITLDSLM